MPKKKLTPSEKQEQRTLEKRRDELSREVKGLERKNAELEEHKHALETGIFRLKDDYSRHNKMILSLVDRKKELEEKLHQLNEELRAKEQEHGT